MIPFAAGVLAGILIAPCALLAALLVGGRRIDQAAVVIDLDDLMAVADAVQEPIPYLLDEPDPAFVSRLRETVTEAAVGGIQWTETDDQLVAEFLDGAS